MSVKKPYIIDRDGLRSILSSIVKHIGDRTVKDITNVNIPEDIEKLASLNTVLQVNDSLKNLYIGYIDSEADLPNNSPRSSFAIVENCVFTSPGFSGLAIFNGTTWDILLTKLADKRELVGVAGTLERPSSVAAKVVTRIKFLPTEGKLDSIENGIWVCPKSGLYSISAFYGTLAQDSDTTVSTIRIKVSDSDTFETVSESTLTSKNKYINIVSYQGQIQEGEMVDFAISLNNKQDKPPTGLSSFSIAPISLHV